MEHLQPVIEIVKEKLARGESLPSVTLELSQKGYTQDQIVFIEEAVTERSSAHRGYKLVIPALIVVVCLMVSLGIFFANWSLPTVSSAEISAAEYQRAFTQDIVVNDRFFEQDYPEVASQLLELRGHLHFDGSKTRYFLHRSHGDHFIYNAQTQTSKRISQPWRTHARCFLAAMSGPGCLYGESHLLTDNGHMFVYVNADAGNVYRNNEATGLYFYDGARWSQIAGPTLKISPRSGERIFQTNDLFVVDEGCAVYFRLANGYYSASVCDPALTASSGDSHNTFTIDDQILSAYLNRTITNEIGKSETDPLAIAFTLKTIPRICEGIPPEHLQRLQVDFGDGTNAPAACGFGKIQHSYAKPGVYNVRLLYDDVVLFQTESSVATFVDVITFDLEVKENDGKFPRGDFYVTINYATDPVCDLSAKDQGRAFIGSRDKYGDGHRIAHYYSSRSQFENGACSGATEYPLTTNPNDKGDTKTIRFEYVIDRVAWEIIDVTFPVTGGSVSDVSVIKIDRAH